MNDRAARLLAWYDRHARTLPWRVQPSDRARGVAPDPYRVWLSRDHAAADDGRRGRTSTMRVSSMRWPTVEAISPRRALEDVLQSNGPGLGYYARARNLHACARAVVASFRRALSRRRARA
jgi:A/G-specific adenine glycosylase